MQGVEVLATVPDWVVPTHDQVVAMLRAGGRRAGGHAFGYQQAASWATNIISATPISRRICELPVTWNEARAECWMAVCAAAEQTAPSEQEFRLLGVPVRPSVATDPDYAHGAWHVLAWLLGERNDLPEPGSQPALRSSRDSFVDLQRQARQRSEAYRRCANVRKRIAAR